MTSYKKGPGQGLGPGQGQGPSHHQILQNNSSSRDQGLGGQGAPQGSSSTSTSQRLANLLLKKQAKLERIRQEKKDKIANFQRKQREDAADSGAAGDDDDEAAAADGVNPAAGPNSAGTGAGGLSPPTRRQRGPDLDQFGGGLGQATQGRGLEGMASGAPEGQGLAAVEDDIYGTSK